MQIESYRRMGPSGRFAVAAKLTNLVRELSRAGIRKRHPDYDAEQVSRELVWIMYRLSAENREN